ncbi:hypothetical protein BOO91_15985 [Vibrio navarrensis]|nr:hypothetical protein [Vibrio navarrensis]MBE3662437.1 hypothetical protein [Vibrio navarrensis]MBE3667801.1 hypothetical protein [Vibrio navarrensis]MBE4602130.1 hypothetical protein [Vibrio navarrensis]
MQKTMFLTILPLGFSDTINLLIARQKFLSKNLPLPILFKRLIISQITNNARTANKTEFSKK